ncbi:RING-type E3 ubiquitin transferase [Ranunculus cassubicifolius]
MPSSALDVMFEDLLNSRSNDSIDSLSFILLGLSRNSTNSDQPAEGPTISINMIVINNASSEELISELGGLKAATKDSIQAMPRVVITEEHKEKECSICLDGWEIGGEAREMPCKHLYHGKCIEKWLGMHGSCPLCRYKMPLDETFTWKASSDVNGGEGEQDRRIRFSFGSFGDRVDTSSDYTMEDVD